MIDTIPEDTDPTDDGEVIKTLKDFKEKGAAMIASLEYVDSLLYAVEQQLYESGQKEMQARIREARERIGTAVKDEKNQLQEEKIAINLLNQLRKWVEEMA